MSPLTEAEVALIFDDQLKAELARLFVLVGDAMEVMSRRAEAAVRSAQDFSRLLVSLGVVAPSVAPHRSGRRRRRPHPGMRRRRLRS